MSPLPWHEHGIRRTRSHPYGRHHSSTCTTATGTLPATTSRRTTSANAYVACARTRSSVAQADHGRANTAHVTHAACKAWRSVCRAASPAGRLMAIEMDKSTEVAPGETIGVDVPWDRIHIFDPKNGQSLKN